MKKLLNLIKIKFSRWLEKMAKANDDYFKGQKPDCCSLNKLNIKK